MTPPPVILAGPTAVGKSAVALRLAEILRGEIVSVDSMQVYRGLDIGTAKPTAAERERIPHHLVDILEINEAFDAAQFVRRAKEALPEIQARGRVPILCGGTGLYFKAFLEGLGVAPPADPQLRAELAQTPMPQLLAELAEKDPQAYATLDLQNPRRVLRAVEVIRLTGKPFSAQRSSWSAPADQSETNASPPTGEFAFGLSRPPGELWNRIDARVDAMFAGGLVAETEELLKRGLSENPHALQALGYRQVVEHLRGVRSLPLTVELVKIRTRQFAKRQMTWFRRQMRLRWISLEGQGEPVAEKLAEEFRSIRS